MEEIEGLNENLQRLISGCEEGEVTEQCGLFSSVNNWYLVVDVT